MTIIPIIPNRYTTHSVIYSRANSHYNDMVCVMFEKDINNIDSIANLQILEMQQYLY